MTPALCKTPHDNRADNPSATSSHSFCEKSDETTAIICAAGKGLRAGFPCNKLLIKADGETVLFRTLSAFDFPMITEIIVAVSKDDFEEVYAVCDRFPRARAVVGGDTRTRSVFNALKEARGKIVLVHDGARPFVTREEIKGCIESVKAHGSGICAVPATETIALSDGGRISSVPPRENAYLLRTPQGFYKEELLSAYLLAAESGETFTDDSSVYARFVAPPYLCAGGRDNIKLTYAEDFSDNFARVGFGVDTHAFGKEQDYILLGGVKIPSASGLIAHSDGDVLLHAVMDALLSAAGLNDIGHYFPDKSDEWKGASSAKMLQIVRGLVEKEGFDVKNLSVAIQAERPKLSNYIDGMRRSLAAMLGIDPAAVGISAGTNEGLGYIGEGKGITVSAYVLLSQIV